MRQIGQLTSEPLAERFVDYLTTQGIAAVVEEDQGTWAVWVRDESHVEAARHEFQQYQQAPDAGKYRDVSREAASIRTEKRKRKRQAEKNYVDMRGKWARPLSRRAPFVTALIVLCVLVAIGSNFGDEASHPGTVMRSLTFVDPHLASADLFASIRQGQWWRLITPIFLHDGLMHLIFNLFCLYYFGTQIEAKRGTWRLGLMVLVIALVSNLAQGLIAGPRFLGMSGVCYGLFGYIWIKTLRDPHSGYLLSRETVGILLIWLVLGFVGALDRLVGSGIANWAHAGGLAAGMALAYVPDMFGPRR
jgi:GlpG protein